MKTFILFLMSFILLSCTVKVSTDTKETKDESVKVLQNLPFPTENNFTREYLMDNFWKCNYSFKNYPKYWVILPNNVKPTKIDPVQTYSNMTNIGQYHTIDKSEYMEVWVFYEVVSDAIQPSDWLLGKLKISDESIIHQNLVNTSNGEKYLDALTYKKMNGENIISRFAVLKNGMNYFFIKVSCSEKDYSVLANKIRHITSNWNVSE